MEKDKVVSRTVCGAPLGSSGYISVFCTRLEGHEGQHRAHWSTEATRPSVPEQGQALSFKEWGKDKFEIDDTHVLFKDVQDYGDYRAALVTSRSEEATVQEVWQPPAKTICFWCGQVFEFNPFGTNDEKASQLTTHAQSCANNPVSRQTQQVAILTEQLQAGAPVAGSAERVAIKAIAEAWKNGDIGCPQSLDTHFEALAGTDTDVAKEKL